MRKKMDYLEDEDDEGEDIILFENKNGKVTIYPALSEFLESNDPEMLEGLKQGK
jgi:hypothetical protein